jgi:hypothetical protein
MRIGAIALFATVALFIAAPSSWGNGVVDHGGRVTQNATQSITAPQTVAPNHGSSLQAAAHTLVVAVLVFAMAVAFIDCVRRRELHTNRYATSPTLRWTQRRGPPQSV